MIQICHMTSAHSSNDVRIFQKECISLAAAGYEVFLVAQGQSSVVSGVNIIGVGEKPHSRLKRMFLFSRVVYKRAIELDCDIYHIHDPELLPFAKKLKKRGKIVIFDSHENHSAQILVREYIPRIIRNYISKAYRSYEISVVKTIDAVISPCTFQGENIFEKYANLTAIVSNYSKLEEFYYKFNPNAIKEDYICYTGLISEANGITDLVLASSRANTKLVLAGASSKYLEKIEKLPEFNSVQYEGYVSRDRVIEIMQHARMGAYINRHIGQNGLVDTFGIKVYEFMAMGLPVIVDSTPYANKVISQYRCGICVPSGDIDAIKDAIMEIIGNPSKAEIMGKNARKAVLSEYNWNTQEAELLDLYKKLLLITKDQKSESKTKNKHN